MSGGIEMYGPVNGNTEFGPVVNGKKFSLPVPRHGIVEATNRVRDASLGVERRRDRGIQVELRVDEVIRE